MLNARAAHGAAAAATPEVATYYPYFQPSEAAAAVLCALFGIGFLVSIWRTFRCKSWIWMVMNVAILSMD